MKNALAVLLTTALSVAPLLRDTNSRAAAARGMKAFARRDYAAAAASFREAGRIAPSAVRDFNLGTAQVAAGSREEGSASLARAMRERSLREPALFNRGNAALAANAVDYAIRDYSAALRLQPGDAAAKRNLEIALRRKAQQDRSGGKGGAPSPVPPAPQPPSQTPQNGQPQPKGGPDAESLLRSVQQQEQEELARMRQQRAVRGHVGW